ncbi:MAG: FmdB family zinc ribbon protein [Ramlibacter sp.]
MPIYAYKCGSCGHAKDVLQKVSDAPLTVCPACGAESFSKQITAAGFQLKGSGWYVTDFRNGGGASSTAAASSKPDDAKSADAKPADGGKPSEAASPAKPDTPSASAGGCGSACACH